MPRQGADALPRSGENKHRSSETGVMLLLKERYRCSSIGVKSVEERNECLHAQTRGENSVNLTWLTLLCCSLQLGYALPPDQSNVSLFLLSHIHTDMTSLPSRAPLQVIHIGKLSMKQHIYRIRKGHVTCDCIVMMAISMSSIPLALPRASLRTLLSMLSAIHCEGHHAWKV